MFSNCVEYGRMNKNDSEGNNTPVEPDCCYLHVFYYIDRLVSALCIISNCDIQMFLHFFPSIFLHSIYGDNRERNVTAWITFFVCLLFFHQSYSLCLCSEVDYIAKNMDPDQTAPWEQSD